jgi:hypothetical protein
MAAEGVMRIGVLVSLLLLGGCLFAPPRFGARGVVKRGEEQYDLYLTHCCGISDQLREACSRWGTPDVIKIGYSGGYFVWREPTMLISVKSFGKTSSTVKIPRDLRFYVVADRVERREKPPASTRVSATDYSIELFERVCDDDFTYRFRLRLRDGADAGLSAMNRIKEELRASVAADYAGAHGGRRADVQVDFPVFALKGGVVEGRAEVMRIDVMSLNYDPRAQKGTMAVKIGSNRFEDARAWVRKNIETLARDKNIVLTTGEIPAAARFYLRGERVKDGSVLEIEFETE